MLSSRKKKAGKRRKKLDPYAGWYDAHDTSPEDKVKVLQAMRPRWGYKDDHDGRTCCKRRMSKYITPDLASLILNNPNDNNLLDQIASETPPLAYSSTRSTEEQSLRKYLRFELEMHFNSVTMYMKKAKELSRAQNIPLGQAVMMEAAKFRPEKATRERRTGKTVHSTSPKKYL